MHDGPLQLPGLKKDYKIEVNKINSSLTQQVDDVLKGDTDDLEDDTDKDDDENEEGASKMTVKTCQRGGKRKWDKKHFCIYCKKAQSKIAWHLERMHKTEEDVAQAVSLPKNSKKQRLLLDQLRHKGDHNHNVTVLQTGQGEDSNVQTTFRRSQST